MPKLILNVKRGRIYALLVEMEVEVEGAKGRRTRA
jgi:hypothetical protein